MNLRPELRDRVDAYLRDVAKAAAHLSTRERDDLIQELQRHISYALHQRGGTDPTLDDVLYVLGEMDDPSAFAKVSGDEPSTVAFHPGPTRWSWFMLALAFLLVNAWGVWRWTGGGNLLAGFSSAVQFAAGDRFTIKGREPLSWSFPKDVDTGSVDMKLSPRAPGRIYWESPTELRFEPQANWPLCTEFEATITGGVRKADGTPCPPTTFRFRTAPLQVTAAEQVGVNAQREAVVRIFFNAPPDRKSLQRMMTLSTPKKDPLTWTEIGESDGAQVLLRTEALTHDELQIEIDEGLLPASGTLGLASDGRFEIKITDSLTLQRVTPSSPAFESCQVEAAFTAAIDVESARGFIDVEPAVEFDIEPMSSWWGGGCILRGDFQPGGIYRLTFRAGLRSTQGTELTHDLVRSIEFPDRPASLAFRTDGRYLAPSGKLQIPVAAMNLRSFTIGAAPLPPHNLAQYALREAGRFSRYYGWSPQHHAENLARAATVLTNELPERPNEEQSVLVDLKKVAAQEAPRGAYLVSVEASAVAPVVRLIVVTDLGLSVRQTDEGALVWVTSLSKAEPVAGAEVTLVTQNGDEAGRGTSDEDGFVFIPAIDADPIIVTASLNGDVTYLSLATAPLQIAEAYSGRSHVGDGYEAYLFTDRGVYRPGETVHVQALVRDEAINAPEQFPVLFRVRQPDGRVYREVSAMLDAKGSAEHAQVLPDYLPTGSYRVEVAMPGDGPAIGSASFSVEDFVPPQIRVNVSGFASHAPVDLDQEVSVSAEHLFGRAAAGLPVSAVVGFEEAPFLAVVWKDYVFGDSEKAFESSVRDLGKTALDEEGRSSYSIQGVAAWRPSARIKATVSATVTESSGRGVSAYASSLLDPYPFYIGVRYAGGRRSVPVGSVQVLDIVAVEPDGNVASNAPGLRIETSRVTWSTVLRRRPDGQFAYVSERTLTPVADSVVAPNAGKASWTNSVDAAGDYVVVVSDPESEASSSIEFHAHAVDDTWETWDRSRPDRLDVQSDRDTYAPGDVAKVTIRSPFEGIGLLTVETDSILERRLIRLSGKSTTVDVPLSADAVPSALCSIALIRPAVAEGTWSAHRAIGSTVLRVAPNGRRLSLELAQPEVVKPQTSFPVRITVRNEGGQPVAGAAVVLMAVDEAICMLTDHETPDPLAWFLAPRDTSIVAHDLFSDLMPIVEDEIGGAASHIAGDASSALRRRLNPIRARRFQPLALWYSKLETDSAGVIATNVALPEFTGEIRLMAVAWNASDAGSADAAVKVRRDVVVETSLPRFLAPGDQVRSKVRLYNTTDSAKQIVLRMTTGGPLTLEDPVREIALPAGGTVEQIFDLVAGSAPGKAVCDVSVESEGFHESIEIAVRPAAPPVTRVVTGAIPPGQTQRFEWSSDLLTAGGEAEVRIAVQPDVQLSGAFDALLTYPYGCLEQTASAAFPLLVLPDLAARVKPGSLGREECMHFAEAAVLRILSMQVSGGGFSLWPRGDRAATWPTLYATHFLIEARAAGLRIPEDRLADALAFVRGVVDRPTARDADPDSSAWLVDREERAYACEVLARSGKPATAWSTRLREEVPRLTFAARVHTANALALSGEPRFAVDILKQLDLPMIRTERDSGGTLGSPVRDIALLLKAWLDTDPQRPEIPHLVDALNSRAEQGRWGTTQDDAMALMALGSYARRVPPGSPTLDVLWNGSEAGAGTNAFASSWSASEAVPFVENKGTSVVYYSMTSHGTPAEPATDDLAQGLSVYRTVYNVAGEELEASILQQGDLVVIRLDVDPMEYVADNVVIVDLLPAGLEIENPALSTSQLVPWITAKQDWCLHRDIRDDRLILFTGTVSSPSQYFYAARVVTPGRFVWPAVRAECMYDPGRKSEQGHAVLEVQE